MGGDGGGVGGGFSNVNYSPSFLLLQLRPCVPGMDDEGAAREPHVYVRPLEMLKVRALSAQAPAHKKRPLRC